MSYELKDYLNAINFTKEPLLDTDDTDWVKKYPPYVINKCLSMHYDTICLLYTSPSPRDVEESRMPSSA